MVRDHERLEARQLGQRSIEVRPRKRVDVRVVGRAQVDGEMANGVIKLEIGEDEDNPWEWVAAFREPEREPQRFERAEAADVDEVAGDGPDWRAIFNF
jgi:hypothetical protein